MSTLRHILALLLLATAIAAGARPAPTLEPETLRYDVMFKWGLINKKAGTAVLSVRNGHDSYITSLTAASEPWADRIYCVRDTLKGSLHREDLRPIFYEKIAHEGGDHKRDRVDYDYSQPGQVIGHCTRKVYKKDELKVDERRQLEAEGTALDMLTSFYYMRTLPFETMTPGDVITMPIFSGKQKETLTIKYVGLDNVSIDGTRYPSYHIRFLFTSRGGTKTSDDMDAWIGTDTHRIPLKLEGKLPIGKVRCFYAGN